MTDQVVAFLIGKSGEAVARVRQMMAAAAEAMDFERAAELRDAVLSLERMEEPSAVLRVAGGDCDVLGFARDGDDACIAILRVRAGKLLAREQVLLEHVEGEADGKILSVFLGGAFLAREERAPELIVPFEFEDADLLGDALLPSRVIVPQRGPRRELIELAEQNARHLLEEFKLAALEVDERAADPVYELARELDLHTIPRSMVCFDISTSQGTDTVGSAVWFENGRPRRADYRKFKVKTVEGTDDFASMREVVGRFFRRLLEDNKPLPDLIVIDGGKGQLSSAHEVLAELSLESIPLISLAKRDEEVFIRGRADSLRLARRSPGLRLLQRIRDEAHRFAITYNRRRRAIRTVTSELLAIPGIGPARRRALLTKFGSLDGVTSAAESEIAQLPGFSVESARKLLDALRRRTEPSSSETDNS